MNYKYLLLGGTLAVLIYATAVIIGGAIRPGYSHISNFVSELIEAGAPNKTLLNPMFALYNLLTFAFAIGLLMFIHTKSGAGNVNIGIIGAYILIAEAVFGFVTIFFPQDVRGTAATTIGTMHIILAGLSSLTTMGAILCFAIWFKHTTGMGGFALYSWISLAVVFISGGITAFSGATNSPIVGLMERITIGAFLQWMMVLGIRLLQPRPLPAK